MRHKLFIILVVIFLILLIHCGGGAKSGRGFRMPDGDPEKGKIAFTDLKCHECHTVKGVELPSPPGVRRRWSCSGERPTRFTPTGIWSLR